MRRKKKKTALPRLTVLAMSNRDLAAFVLAVENLSRHVADLRQIVTDLSSVAKTKRQKKAPKEPAPPAYEPISPSLPGMGGVE